MLMMTLQHSTIGGAGESMYQGKCLVLVCHVSIESGSERSHVCITNTIQQMPVA